MNKVRRLCEKKGVSLQAMLEASQVSRNAFYSLARKEAILPKSVIAIADCIGVRPVKLLDDAPTPLLCRHNPLIMKGREPQTVEDESKSISTAHLPPAAQTTG